MIMTLSGSNSLAIADELKQILNTHSKEYGPNTIERFDGSDIGSLDALLDAVRSISFLEPKKLVIVRDFFQSKELVEGIENLLKQVADTTGLILIDEKLDKRSKAYNFLKGNTEFKIFTDLNPQQLEQWVTNVFKENGVEVGTREVRLLIDLAGTSQQHLSNEIEKLSLYAPVISQEVINALVEPTPQSKIFTMLDALFSGEAKKAWELYQDQRLQGVEHQQIIAMITWQLQQLALAVHSSPKSESSLTSTGMSPYSAKKSLQLAKRISKIDLRYYVNSLADTDYIIKTSAEAESALETFFSDVAQKYQRTKTLIS